MPPTRGGTLLRVLPVTMLNAWYAIFIRRTWVHSRPWVDARGKRYLSTLPSCGFPNEAKAWGAALTVSPRIRKRCLRLGTWSSTPKVQPRCPDLSSPGVGCVYSSVLLLFKTAFNIATYSLRTQSSDGCKTQRTRHGHAF